MQNVHLTVVHEFGPYRLGHRITAADEVAMVLASPQHTHVVKTAAPAEEAPEADPAAEGHDA